jgi:hypothetical protein
MQGAFFGSQIGNKGDQENYRIRVTAFYHSTVLSDPGVDLFASGTHGEIMLLSQAGAL